MTPSHASNDSRDSQGLRSSDRPDVDALGALLALEASVVRAEEILETGRLSDALAAWERIIEIAGDLFGPHDAAVVDAERVVAAILVRLGRIGEARLTLTVAASRLDGVAAEAEVRSGVDRDLRRLDELTARPTLAAG